MKKFNLTLLVVLSGFLTFGQNQIIPAPVSYESTGALFTLDQNVSITLKTSDAEVASYTRLFQDFLAQSGTNLPLKEITNPDRNNKAIIIALNQTPNKELGAEGYTLDVKEHVINLNANKAAGIFNGYQSLRQLLPAQFENKEKRMGMGMIQGCKITDYPRFGWRGLMLDVSRHFFSVDDVKAYLDKMAQYKLNTFHWHLTDDEGWRIEIKSLPKLTEVGAWRVERNGRFGVDRPMPEEGEKATSGGFYTHEQIKDVVAYAAARNITIVPELDFPGHSMAALAAYPELSTLKEPHFVNPGGYFADWTGPHFKMLVENTVNPADKNVYEFIDKIMTEVAELFPGEYIHMGGDEAYHGYWEKDAKVQKFMKKKKLKDTHELQSYFVKEVEKIISSKGKKLIGWDEILEGGLADGAAVMSWRGLKGGIEAAKMGHNVVMSPTTYAYLDYTQGDPSVENKIYASLSLKKAYSFDPVPEGVDEKYVLGAQGNLWTEVVPNLQYAFYMTYPRAFAIAETAWSPSTQKNYSNFVRRTETHFRRFDEAGTNVSKAILDPIIEVSKDEKEAIIISLSADVANTEIYYTTDNTYPVKFGQKYTGPFELPEGDFSLRTQTYQNSRPIGRALQVHRKELLKRLK